MINHKIDSFFSGLEDIYEINLTNKTIIALGTNIKNYYDFFTYINSGDIVNFFYYEPTNDVYFDLSGLHMSKLNLASLEYSNIIHASSQPVPIYTQGYASATQFIVEE